MNQCAKGDQMSHYSLSSTKLTILKTIAHYPLISHGQLARLLHLQTRNLSLHLQHLQQQGWLLRYSIPMPYPRRATTHTTVLLLTRSALELLAQHAGVPCDKFSAATDYTARRLGWLLLSFERTFLVREFLCALAQHPVWQLVHHIPQVAFLASTHNATLSIPFDALALIRTPTPEPQQVALAIEVDTGATPILMQRTRLAHLCLAQLDERFLGFDEDKRFPILVFLAANVERLNEYRRVLLSLYHLASIVPRLFLITHSNLTRWLRTPDAPLWETELPDTPVPFLHGVVGSPDALGTLLTVARIPRRRRANSRASCWPGDLQEIFRLAAGQAIKPRLAPTELAALALTLSACDKVLLERIGAHPLLSADELAFELQHTATYVRRRLARLQQWRLVEAHMPPPALHSHYTTRQNAPRARTRYYVLAERGVQFLATRATYGAAVERFARFKGWKQRFVPLLDHWVHTRLENQVFLQLLRYARHHQHHLEWFSELEARLYLDDPAAHVSTSYGYATSPHPRTRRARRSEEYSEDEEGTTYRLSPRARAQALAERGHRLRSFLPDGMAIYTSATRRISIALEVDRTRVNAHKIARKLSAYSLGLLHQAGDWQILVVTSGWERAAHWSWYTFRFAQRSYTWGQPDEMGRAEFIASLQRNHQWEEFLTQWLLPVWVTTAAALSREGIAAPIWLDARAWADLAQNPYARKRLDWL